MTFWLIHSPVILYNTMVRANMFSSSARRPDTLWGPPSLPVSAYQSSYPGVKRSWRAVMLTTHVHLASRLRIGGAISLLPYMPLWRRQVNPLACKECILEGFKTKPRLTDARSTAVKSVNVNLKSHNIRFPQHLQKHSDTLCVRHASAAYWKRRKAGAPVCMTRMSVCRGAVQGGLW
jgi:hypothetical protein